MHMCRRCVYGGQAVCVCHVGLCSHMCMLVYNGPYVSLYVWNVHLRHGGGEMDLIPATLKERKQTEWALLSFF